MAKKNINARLTDEQTQAIIARFGTPTIGVNALAGVSAEMDGLMEFFEDPTAALSWTVEMFPAMIKRTWAEIRGKFTRGELSMIADVMNGTATLSMGMGRSAGQHITLNVADSFGLYPGQYEEQWGVVRDTLMEKIQALTSFQRVSLEFWAAQFWAASDLNALDHDDRMMALLGA